MPRDIPTAPVEILLNELSRLTIRVLALDPGETTGIAYFEGPTLKIYQQIKEPTVELAASHLKDVIELYKPDIVVMEDYRVYSWKTKDHAWNSLHTSRLIGAVEYVCFERRVPLWKQMAQMPKGFCTDDKLRALGYYVGGKHARDAVRHGLYYLLFDSAKVHQLKEPQ